MQSRRNFIERVATGIAGTLATSNVLSANDRVRLGIIGCGARGSEILREALTFPNVECVGAADIYTRRLDEARQIAPNTKTYSDYRQLLEDQSIDAVLIATPQHLHSEHFVAALDAGKHVYQEKTMAFSVEHAKRMRVAVQKTKNRAVSIGHQWTSYGHVPDALSFLRPELMGKITAIDARMYRNTAHGKPQWSRPVYPDMTEENIVWSAFLGDAPKRDFDANRYLNWRFFWDYSGGNVYENLCHQLSFWYKVMDLQIPREVTMTGGVFLWNDGREVPDTMNVSMIHPDEELMFNWTSGFGNDKLGMSEEVLGANGTISHTPQSIRYAPQKVNRRDGNEMTGATRNEKGGHMLNFIQTVRDPNLPANCPFDLGYRVSIACRMAVESYLLQRTVRWDCQQEEIV